MTPLLDPYIGMIPKKFYLYSISHLQSTSKRGKLHVRFDFRILCKREGKKAARKLWVKVRKLNGNAGEKHQELAGYFDLYDSDFRVRKYTRERFFILAIHCGPNWEGKVQFNDRKIKFDFSLLSNQTIIKSNNIY